ncbi:MAG: DUF2510 domain-containing protein [Acidimicrobiales bacterium]
MYYGHESWIALAIFGGMFVMRALASQRRRSASGRSPGQQRSFTAPPRTPPTAAPTERTAATATSASSTGTAPGWFTDPFVRHQHRYWSGSEWTEHVSDDGVPGTDPPPPGRGAEAAG